MRKADIGIFNLTPFRGPSADVGTVFELGFMVGLNKRVFGYTNDSNDYTDRVIQHFQIEFKKSVLKDPNNMIVEQFGNVDNLMIDWAIAEHGGKKIQKSSIAGVVNFDDLTAFEACLRHAAETVAKSA